MKRRREVKREREGKKEAGREREGETEATALE